MGWGDRQDGSGSKHAVQHRHTGKRTLARGEPTLARRELLKWAGVTGGLLASGALAAGCAEADATSAEILLPRPDHPVRWDVDRSSIIKSGLEPERGATLQIYSWEAYINQKVINEFCKRYHCQAQVTTFGSMSEAMSKLQTGQLKFDIFFPTLDVLGQLVEGKLLSPLNHSYIPNISQTWNEFEDPFYDLGWQYTVPYTVYTTGLAWRKDLVAEDPYRMAQPWSMMWNRAYKGKVAIFDDYREAISLGLLKSGITDLNTTDEGQIATSLAALEELQSLTDVQINDSDFSNIPAGQSWVQQAWSGDMASSWQYLPKGGKVSNIGYWYSPNGESPVMNDTLAILSTVQNPVLAHLFLNYFLDVDNALENISFTGYQQPLNSITSERLISEQIIPAALASTTVPRSYFSRGLKELALPPDANDKWELAWMKFGGGL